MIKRLSVTGLLLALILLALIMWLYQDRDAATVKKCLQWGLLGFLCVSIHSYFLPMAAMFLLAVVFTQLVKGKHEKRHDRQHTEEIR